MELFAEPEQPIQVADRPPRRELTKGERSASNDALRDAMAGDPETLARVLSVAVFRLSPMGLREVANLVLNLTSYGGEHVDGSSGNQERPEDRGQAD